MRRIGPGQDGTSSQPRGMTFSPGGSLQIGLSAGHRRLCNFGKSQPGAISLLVRAP
jgi:hypothetical protein